MRTHLIKAFVVAATVLAPAVAAADAADSLVGRYEVGFEQVTSNCQSTGLTLDKSALVISKRAPGVAVEMAKVGTLTGPAAKAGRLKAAAKVAKGATGIAADGKFSIAGTIDDTGKLDAVFVAEFFQDGKPLCTQSWSATGTRTGEVKSAAPSAVPTVPMAAFARFTGLAPME